MKVTFVYPRFEKFLQSCPELADELSDYFLGKFTTPPSLGIPLLAAMTPPDWDVELVDDNNGDPVDFHAETDLVAINCFTPQATRALELADGYRRAGRLVVMGGMFPSHRVEECLEHAHAVCVGEGEPVWGRILEDARQGRLQPRYDGGCRMDLADLPVPRREIFYGKTTYDWDEDLIQLTRGCTYNCAMCVLPTHMGERIRFRPIEKVVEEIARLKYENVYLADDTLFFPQRKMREYSQKLFEALIPYGKKFFVSSTLALNTDPALLDLAARAGLANFYCTMNVDPVSIRALRGEKAERHALVDLVKMLEDRGIRFFGSCALGRDWDDTSIADRILDLFGEAGIHTSEFFLFTPYPGTPHWERLERQGRIIDRIWRHYNGAHVVARPLEMTPEQLREQFIKVWKGFYASQRDRHVSSLEPSTWRDGAQVVGKPLASRGVRGQAVITGMGMLSPIGCDEQEVVSSLRECRHGIRPIEAFDPTPFRTHLAGQINGFDPAKHLSPEEVEALEDRYLQYAVAAARAALRDAGLSLTPGQPNRDVALVFGTCNAGLLTAEIEYAWKHGKHPRAFDEAMNLQAHPFGSGKALSWALGLGGDAWIVTTACSSSTAALGLAQLLIRRGLYKKVLVGGSDSLCMANLCGFDSLKATSPERTAPFSVPVGLNVGEGAAFWVLEEMESALLRNARMLGRLTGAATSSDAYHPTTPDPRGDGAYRTLQQALEAAGLSVDQIAYVNAHGTGTEANDRAESRAISRLIGTSSVPVVSLKSFFGHCMGATGIMEATCSVWTLQAGFIPPTINFTEPRPGCGLDYVPNTPRVQPHDAFLSANYAFGGNNAAVVVTAVDHPHVQPPRPRLRVAVTGLGVVTSCGVGVSELLQHLRDGHVGLVDVASLNLPHVRSRLAGLLPDFTGDKVDRRLDLSGLTPIARFATVAARLALGDANLRVSPRNAAEYGIVMGVCNGPSEMGHMDAVFEGDVPVANVMSFSNITANSTAGHVSCSLCLKGVNLSLAPGPGAGLQALAFGYEAISDGQAHGILAEAADEVFAQTYSNYDGIGFLYAGDDERDFRIHLDEPRRKVLGEGAGALLLEPLDAARERGAPVYAEVLGYGMSTDGGPMHGQLLDPAGLVHAIRVALRRAEVSAGDVGLGVWAPQGNAQDRKVLEALAAVGLDQLPLVTTSLHTGFIEAASILVSVAAALGALREQQGQGTSPPTFWSQRTGIPDLDARTPAARPRHVLAVSSSDVGYNFAVLLAVPQD